MVKFGEREIAIEKFDNIIDNIDNIVISKLVTTKAIRPLVLIMLKMSGYVKTFDVKHGGKDKNNKLMSFRIDDEKLLEMYKAIWNKIEDLKNIKLNALPVYDDRYIKTKIKTYGDNVCTNFPA